MAASRIVVDDPTIFPIVARIPYVMLKLVDPQNLLLVQYLASIDSTISIGVLPSKRAEGSSKSSKAPKKKKVEKPPIVDEGVTKEIVPSKFGILTRTKKPSLKPNDSPIKQSMQDLEIEATEKTHVDSSHTQSS
ncbi:unnamed protein product [Lactuca saligna]|uniref:Uncharacterized protein n=1 Tax=Lactuca saligna TaxID=75948 RepID=A0AA36A1W1_LACSI|nr:unnamed protein product [Lactuca saligna]